MRSIKLRRIDMKRQVTTITKEYDKEGNLINEITETTLEEDDGYIYPQQPYRWCPPTGNPLVSTCEGACNCNKE